MTNLLIKLFVKDSKNTSDPAVRKRYGYLGAFTGIVLNILLFLGKLIAGILSGGISVIADAFNNLSDAGSSIMTFVGFKMAGMPADSEHPYGHGRMEYVLSLIHISPQKALRRAVAMPFLRCSFVTIIGAPFTLFCV